MRGRWRVRCGYGRPIGVWCAACHALVIAELRQRELLPVGGLSCVEDGPAPQYLLLTVDTRCRGRGHGPLEDGSPWQDVADTPVEEVQMWSYSNLTEQQMGQVHRHRQAECELRREYLETTFTELITELSVKVEGLQKASLYGNDDPDEREKLEKRLRDLKARKQRRLDDLELMLRLTANLPDVVTSALVVPAAVAVLDPVEPPASGGFPMRRDDEVERVAMEVTMRYERARGWNPTDVSQDGEHYDIRSEGPNAAKRFIEVKGRAQTGGVVLTAPEVDKLRQLGDRAFLYIVTYCRGEKSKLRIIQDPMDNLHPAMLYRQVQYFVDEADWKQHGDDHDCPPVD